MPKSDGLVVTREKIKTMGERATDFLDVAPTDAPPRQKRREERGGGDEGKEGGRRDTREEGDGGASVWTV